MPSAENSSANSDCSPGLERLLARASLINRFSAKKYLHTAGQFREDIARGDKADKLGVHHLMAVYIYRPWVHDKDLERLGIDRTNWSNAFQELMRQICPKEIDFWRNEHLKTFHEY